MTSLRLAFMGSPAFAVPALQALHGAGHNIMAVYTQPPRPAGRGKMLRRSAVHGAAEALGMLVRHPPRLRHDTDAHAAFAALDLDAAVVAAYGLILPPAMLGAPRRGCLNIHASLLPRWRGAAPIQAAILAGDLETGVTIMQMDAGLDTGPVLMVGRTPIGPYTTAAELHDTLGALGAELMLQTLDTQPPPVPQPDHGATYAEKLVRESGRIDWNQPAAVLDRQVRAMTPWPGTWTVIGDTTLKVLQAVTEAANGPPGTVLDSALLVACNGGALRLLRVQQPGGAPMSAAAWLNGHPIHYGMRIESTHT